MAGRAPGRRPASTARSTGDDYAGKLLRMRDDGSLPADNPFVGKAGLQALRLRDGVPESARTGDSTLYNGEIWAGEQGPNLGDEVNVIVAGKETTAGRSLATVATTGVRGSYLGIAARGFEEPTLYWVPAIALSGMTFYDGDRFPNWKRNLFVGRHARRRDVADWDSCSGSCSTTNGRSCGVRRCCAICINASVTCGKVRTGCST